MADDARANLRKHGFIRALEAGLRRCGVKPGDRILAAVSGGADSTALLVGLMVIAPLRQWRLDVRAMHVNHHLRADSERDAEFVEALAARLGAAYGRRDVQPRDAGGNLEAAARRMRYAALEQAARDMAADAVATAHHADDQLETMLMRLTRGASVRGMGGMSPRRKLGATALVRPLLGVGRVMVWEFLAAADQPWREDSTNADLSRARAKLRVEVLPALRELSGSAAEKAADTAARLRAAARLIGRMARRAEKQHVRDGVMTREAARKLPRELLGEIIRRGCLRCGASADKLPSRTVERIVEAARDNRGEPRMFELSNGVNVEVTADAMRWESGTRNPGGGIGE